MIGAGLYALGGGNDEHRDGDEEPNGERIASITWVVNPRPA